MRALLAEQEISRLKVGLPAEVTPVGQDRSVAGSIWLLSPIVNPQTRQGEARIAIKPDANIRPGGFASARIMAGSADQPLLPESAVQSDSSGAFVMVVNQNNEVERRPVTLGEIRSEEHTSELQSLMRNSYAVFCVKKKNKQKKQGQKADKKTPRKIKQKKQETQPNKSQEQ